MDVLHRVEIQVEEPLGPVETEALERAALVVLAQQGVQIPCEVVVVISDEETLRELNLRFRGVNAPTDVLSFPDDTRGPFAALGGIDEPRYLGDIVISLPRAEIQAAAAGGTVTQELQLLVVHGVLHLLGHDHGKPEEKARMWAAQAEILHYLGVDIPLPE
jgi:probable rRNA maturation factor